MAQEKRMRCSVARNCPQVTLLIAALAVTASTRVLAQRTTGALEVKLVRAGGAPIQGGSVTVLGPGFPAQQISDARGYARFVALPVGVQTVRVRGIGYRQVEVQNVVIRLGRTATHEIRLEAIANELEPIRVVASRPLIDASSTDVGLALQRDDFAKLPIAREYPALATLAPHNNVSYLGDDINVAGATGLENTYYIDGVNVTDIFGVRTQGTQLPYNFIRDVEVRTGGYKAEHRSALGGTLNVVTPTGTNALSGEVFSFGTHNRIAAASRHGVAQPSTRGAVGADVGFSVGGPIMRGRLWFFGAYNYAVERDEVLLPGLDFFTDRRTAQRAAMKLTWHPQQRTSMQITVLGDPSSRESVGSTFGAYATAAQFANPDPALGKSRSGGLTTAVHVQHQLSPRLLMEWSGSRLARADENEPASVRGAEEVRFFDRATGVVSGGYPERVRYATTRSQATASATLLRPSHTTKVGIAVVDNGLDQDASMRALNLQNPTIPRYRLFRDEAHGTVHNRVLGAFAQDDWRLTERLTLNIGLRWDGQHLIDSEGKTGVTIVDQWQPRLGVVFQPGRTGTQKLFGSFGRFYQDLHLAASAQHLDYSTFKAFTFYTHDPRLDSLGGTGSPDVFERESPGLKGQFHDEVTLGYERLVGADLTIGLRAISRRVRQGIENSYDTTTRTWVLGNPGRGRLSGCPRPRREYDAVELTLSGNLRPHLRLLGSYVLSRTYGNYGGLFNADFEFLYANRNGWYDRCDEGAQFSTGYLPNDRRHALKLAGSLRVGREVTVGSVLLWTTGTPLSELGGTVLPSGATFVSRRGTAGRTPTLLDLNVRVAYAPAILRRGSATPTVLVDVFHIGNRRRVVDVDQRHYFGRDSQGNYTEPSVTYGKATRYEPATSARLGLVMGF